MVCKLCCLCQQKGGSVQLATKCGIHLYHTTCLEAFSKVYTRKCYFCQTAKIKFVNKTEIPFPINCPITTCKGHILPDFSSLKQHFKEKHIPKNCRICQGAFVESQKDLHYANCLDDWTMCPASGCKNTVRGTMARDAHDDANILVKHHQCKWLHHCSNCTQKFLMIKDLRYHLSNNHTDESFAKFDRPKRKAAQMCNHYISAVHKTMPDFDYRTKNDKPLNIKFYDSLKCPHCDDYLSTKVAKKFHATHNNQLLRDHHNCHC